MFISLVIVVSFVSLGKIMGNIGEAMKKTKKWHTWYVPQNKRRHIILAGAPNGYYLKFFAEIFSDSQRGEGENIPSICVLSPGDPSEELSLLISQLHPALQYIDGSVCQNTPRALSPGLFSNCVKRFQLCILLCVCPPTRFLQVLSESDLERARASHAQAIMVTPRDNVGGKCSIEEGDDNCVLSAISIFRYFQKIHSEVLLLCHPPALPSSPWHHPPTAQSRTFAARFTIFCARSALSCFFGPPRGGVSRSGLVRRRGGARKRRGGGKRRRARGAQPLF